MENSYRYCVIKNHSLECNICLDTNTVNLQSWKLKGVNETADNHSLMVAFRVLIPMIRPLITVAGKSEISQCATFNGNNISNSSAQQNHYPSTYGFGTQNMM